MKKLGKFIFSLLGICLMASCGNTDNTDDTSKKTGANISETTDSEDESVDRGEAALVLEGDEGVSLSFNKFSSDTGLYEVNVTIASGYELISTTVKDKNDNDIAFSYKDESNSAIVFYDITSGRIYITSKSKKSSVPEQAKWDALLALGTKGKTYYCTQYLNGLEMYEVYGRVTDDFAIKKTVYGGRTYTTFDYVKGTKVVDLGEGQTMTVEGEAIEYINEKNELALNFTYLEWSDDDYSGDSALMDYLYRMVAPDEDSELTQQETLESRFSYSFDDEGNTIFTSIASETTTTVFYEIGYEFIMNYEPLNTFGIDHEPTFRIVVSPDNKIQSFTMTLKSFTIGETYSADNELVYVFHDWPYAEIEHESPKPVEKKTMSSQMETDFNTLYTLENKNYSVEVSSDNLSEEGLPTAMGSLADVYKGNIYYGQLDDGRDAAYSTLTYFTYPDVSYPKYDGMYAFYSESLSGASAGYYAIGDNTSNYDPEDSDSALYDKRIYGATRSLFEQTPSGISTDFFTEKNRVYTFDLNRENAYSSYLSNTLKTYLIPSLDVAVGSYHNSLGFYTRYQSNTINAVKIDFSDYDTTKSFTVTLDMTVSFTNTNSNYSVSVDYRFYDIGTTSLSAKKDKFDTIIKAFNEQYSATTSEL